jgi:SagB-type dehydrogenase family enzyme
VTAASSRVRFRRSPHLVSYWAEGALTFTNYATGISITAEPLTTAILDFFGRWRSERALAAHLSEYTPASLAQAVRTLGRFSLLIRSDAAADERSEAMDAWARWNPAAGFFHFATKDVRFARDQDWVDRFLNRKAKNVPMPPPVRRFPGARPVTLPPIDARGEFPDVLLGRRTWRTFSRQPLRLSDLSTLLGLTWRIQGWMHLRQRGRLPMKTSPSGGSLHPIELYVLARRVEGVAPGLYHYAADRHRLELLKRGATRAQIVRYLPMQTWFGTASALMLMTAVFPRTQWKYGFPRAYRVVLAEAGHLCQTFCLTATWLGLAPFCTMALADSRIERDLGIDGVTESILYAAGVGVRPSNGVPILPTWSAAAL